MTDTTIISTSELMHLKRIQADYMRMQGMEVKCRCLEQAREHLLSYISKCKEGDDVNRIRRMVETFMGETE